MTPSPLYPLRFEPIFKSVIWGGHSLRPFLGESPSSEPTGEAWVLSDQGVGESDNSSHVANGPLAGATLRQLMATREVELIGDASARNGRFPLLLKFLDARENLSVQVHPNDEQARRLEPGGSGLGKTEAWVILKAEPGSRIYAGLREGVDRARFHDALKNGMLPDMLHSYEPRPGDCVFLEAGTVHAIGAGLMLFEVQQTSDITYRLYDWGRVDDRTGQPRQLHIEQAIACTNEKIGPCNPVTPERVDDIHVRLVNCRYFTLDRLAASTAFTVDTAGTCRIVVCVSGSGSLSFAGGCEPLRAGAVFLLPAAVGACAIVPDTAITILECAIAGQEINSKPLSQ